ncbi:MAG: RidA family protein [Alphaproteobacteria bacterium]|nr:RidA family protein [Alphaproteobacteria bacterium]
MAITRIDSGPRMSRAVVHGDTVYLQGLTATNPSEDIKGQTRQVLARIEEALAQVGSNKSKLLSVNIWLSNIGHFAGMNEVWDAWVDKANAPARATVESKLARPEILVEMMCVAAK